MRPRAQERKAGISMLILRFLLSPTFIKQSEDHFSKFETYIEVLTAKNENINDNMDNGNIKTNPL